MLTERQKEKDKDRDLERKSESGQYTFIAFVIQGKLQMEKKT